MYNISKFKRSTQPKSLSVFEKSHFFSNHNTLIIKPTRTTRIITPSAATRSCAHSIITIERREVKAPAIFRRDWSEKLHMAAKVVRVFVPIHLHMLNWRCDNVARTMRRRRPTNARCALFGRRPPPLLLVVAFSTCAIYSNATAID